MYFDCFKVLLLSLIVYYYLQSILSFSIRLIKILPKGSIVQKYTLPSFLSFSFCVAVFLALSCLDGNAEPQKKLFPLLPKKAQFRNQNVVKQNQKNDGQQNQKNDGQQNQKNDGQQNQKNDGQQNQKNDGQQNQKNDGQQNQKNDGQQNQKKLAK